MTSPYINVDLYCGGGGASEGFRMATGRDPDVAVNHDPKAIAMHQANHPGTLHICQDMWTCPPRWATRGKPVAWLHASPDCTHHSKAKGGPPRRDAKRRDLPWTVVKWIRELLPICVSMENVEEITSWGPCDRHGVPIPSQSGVSFKSFVATIRRLGYAVQWRELRACDYGAPTIRKRLFLIARRDGKPIVWPAPTHGDPASEAVQSGQLKPWRTAAECIDWRHPCPSIFERKRPLAENTLHRIAEGIERYVVRTAKPFIVTYYGPKKPGDFRGCGLDEQLATQTTENRHALVSPFLAGAGGPVYAGKPVPADRPMGTLMTENHQALVAPFLTEHANASSQRTFNAAEPMRTQCANVKGGHFSLVTPVMVTNTSGHAASPVDCQMPTLTTGQQQMLSAAFLAKHYGGVVGHELERPIGSVTTVDHHSLVTASVQKFYGTGVGSSADEPLHTVTAGGPNGDGRKHGLLTSHLVKLRGTCKAGQPVDEPAATITSGGNHLGEVRACAIKYYGQGIGQDLQDPAATVTTRDRMAVVEARPVGDHAQEVRELLRWHRRSKADKAWRYRCDDFDGLFDDAFAGQVCLEGGVYYIADIGLRMFQPRELYLAQGFPPTYIIGDDPSQGLSLTKADQVHMCGNSVSPEPMAALVRANYVEPLRVERVLPLLAGAGEGL